MQVNKANIEIKKIENGGNKDALLYRKMYEDYIAEQQAYTDVNLSTTPTFTPGRHKNLILCDNEAAGFLSFSTYPESLSRNDVFIKELYVRPEYRRRKIGTQAMMKILWDKYKNHDICHFIFDKNSGGIDFVIYLFNLVDYRERSEAREITSRRNRTGERFLYWVKK